LVVNGERERPEFLRRIDAIAPWVVDVALVLVVLPLTLALSARGLHAGGAAGHAAAVASTTILSTLPLLVRRRWPVQVLVVILVAGVAIPTALVFLPAALVAVYTIAARRPWRIAVASAIAATVAFDVHRVIWGYGQSLLAVIAGIALSGAALALGLYRQTRQEYFEQLRERAARLERERELLGQQAASEERLRIARELHDVVAHNVSLMVIQAQALETTAEDPESARRGAHTIADLGRDAMSEMHRTLELMRTDGKDEERKPQPELSDLGPLLERARAAGVDVELSVSGAPRPLPTGVELSAYRIVQEALTNVIKHSGSHHARVVLRYGDAGLELEIVDQGGAGGESGGPASGHGLVGMRERVALFGGSLEAGPENGRGYRVRATLPYTQ
jgi:signal transduction histidine kinase